MAELRFEKCQGYIASQARRLKEKGRIAGHDPPAITISRETGAGAVTFADYLAEYLNQKFPSAECAWTVFDKNLVKQVLEDHDLPARLEEFMPEDRPKHVEDAVGDMLGVHPPNWKLVEHAEDTIYRLAKMGNCILVGRGANIVTEDLPNVFRLRLVGSLEARVKRCMDFYKIAEKAARDLIKTQDRGRRRYLLAYFDRDVDDPLDYNMVINVDSFTSESLARLISEWVTNRSR